MQLSSMALLLFCVAGQAETSSESWPPTKQNSESLTYVGYISVERDRVLDVRAKEQNGNYFVALESGGTKVPICADWYHIVSRLVGVKVRATGKLRRMETGSMFQVSRLEIYDRAVLPQPPLTTVRIDRTGGAVVLHGRLGCPLREMVTVLGTWVEHIEQRSKPDTWLRFRATHVNGKPLDQPVHFHPYDVTIVQKSGAEPEPAKGQRWELRAYETWPNRDHPAEYWKELDAMPRQPPHYGPTQIIGVLKQRTAP